jgi:hypothetical protein
LTNADIEKPVWTEADFEQMGWHDVHVHAVAFRPQIFELWLDMDYIFRWVDPHDGETHYSFWVAPATLVFENVYDLKFDIESHDGNRRQRRERRRTRSSVSSVTSC